MYLHEDTEQFEEAIAMTAFHTHMSEMVVEKDYYITMILRLLTQKLPFVVFKGGTSLSKCHKVIKRLQRKIIWRIRQHMLHSFNQVIINSKHCFL